MMKLTSTLVIFVGACQSLPQGGGQSDPVAGKIQVKTTEHIRNSFLNASLDFLSRVRYDCENTEDCKAYHVCHGSYRGGK